MRMCGCFDALRASDRSFSLCKSPNMRRFVGGVVMYKKLLFFMGLMGNVQLDGMLLCVAARVARQLPTGTRGLGVLCTATVHEKIAALKQREQECIVRLNGFDRVVRHYPKEAGLISADCARLVDELRCIKKELERLHALTKI